MLHYSLLYGRTFPLLDTRSLRLFLPVNGPFNTSIYLMHPTIWTW